MDFSRESAQSGRMSDTAAAIIERLGLERHPEGGWFRETWRADAAPGERASATAIYFLLDAGERSHWHRVDAAELWLWHAGDPLILSIAPGEQGPVERVTLGPDVLAGQAPQALVPPGCWQAAEPAGGWALVSCVVSPGFEFSGFELAAEGWSPGPRS
jgi:predicted cupin superfamily sugar epimerase